MSIIIFLSIKCFYTHLKKKTKDKNVNPNLNTTESWENLIPDKLNTGMWLI